jgi:type VI secretion system protein ImpJ
MNRAESLLVHLGGVRPLHPENLFRHFLEIAGELATYLEETRRPGELPLYRHHDLRASFEPLLKILRKAPSGTPTAYQLALEDLGFGIFNAEIADRNLLTSGRFVFAVRADIGTEDLLARVRDLIKVAALENIRPTVMEGVRGIPFRALTVAPKQIPFHAGFAYFELERRGPHWAALETSGGLALYLPETRFPNFGVELWWIGD